MRIQRGGGGGSPDPQRRKNYKNIGFLSNTGPGPQKNHKATQARIWRPLTKLSSPWMTTIGVSVSFDPEQN